MNNTLFRRTVIVWLLVCLISGVLLYAEQIRRQFWERDREFSTRYSTLSAVLTQNESVLPLLNGEEDLAALRKKFPHILALEKTSGRALNAARVESTRDCQYWLYNPWRQIRVLIDLAPLLSTQHTFDALAIRFNDADNAPPAGAFWHWQRTFTQPTQPFTLMATAKPHWLAVSWWVYPFLFFGWAVLIAAASLLLWQRRQRQHAEQRAHYYQHARLNTLGEITAGIVHEINQPLTAVQTWIQGAQRQQQQANPQAVSQALAAALVQTQRISALLTRFREHVVQEKVTLRDIDLKPCWQQVVDLLEHERRSEHIAVSHAFAAGATRVLADRLWLEQVLHNLLSNAIQAQQECAQGWVKITSEKRENWIYITLTDGGPGFSPEALQNAFMPFYSGRTEGIGLGMTLTESLMTRMNGSITLGNAPQGGAQVRLQLASGEVNTRG
ncbi:TPA: sensor histidine kinase [Enterobacter ludwigii]|jgi:signal transduction histidine kinase|uniref:sensor histidine kinase n=1 Tax=Enterobacter TaxID=547 RepID=UPI0015F6A73F|nr:MULTISPECIES: ATP-binding protein [Enterobacter]MBA7771536.1 two-component sensor histidine kinase [Enterobacter sp. RHBSTW-00974]MBA7774991.1 two-component sensor histidine kinase [Enterobacter sp. RHBSTW-00318]MBA7828456.1 two-component sensor histidine kinase [Enterobacter sp. RHBSTW-00340]MBA8036250.1 two-component sensor histidine kinase [Enterobacter sp. RHBSTW-00131]MBG0585720.1 two-component sensor histidine kinase [Enterobacter ludwigii]